MESNNVVTMRVTLDFIKEQVEEIKQIIKNDADKYVLKEDFKEFTNSTKDSFQWVNDRKAVEKFIYGVVTFLGIANILLIIKVVAS